MELQVADKTFYLQNTARFL